MRLMGMGLSAAAMAAALVTVGCSSGLSPSEEQLVSSEQRWADNGPSSYTMVITRSSLIGVSFAARVTVTNRVVTDRQFVDDGGNPTGPVPAGQAADYPDVDGLFVLVRKAFDEAQTVNVTFDATYGFPNSIVINYDRVTLDDDLTVAVTQFTPTS